MASDTNTADIGFERQIWKAADILRGELDKRRFGDVVDLFTNIQMIEHEAGKDILGRAYECCLSKFAEQEGKRAGEFYTPSCVVRTIVEALQPFKGRVYDPCRGSGGMFVQSTDFVKKHSGNIGNLSVYGQDANPTIRKIGAIGYDI
jgi:type I restriction enzyme M protein